VWGKAENARTLGYVVFEFSQDAVTKAKNRIFIWFTLVFLIAVGITVFFTRSVLKRLLRPVVKLGEAARELADGNLEFPIDEAHGRDEIASATNSFIAMRKAQAVYMRFSNPALNRKILKGIAPDKAEEVKLTIGFGDGVKFTNWSGAHTAHEIAEMLTDYFSIAGTLIDQFDGIIEKFIGDAIMSYWGIEAGDPKIHAQQAIKAKLAIQHAFGLANWAFKKFKGRFPLRFRFGIATGKTVVGPIGARGIKLDYTIIGSPVNLASRLEGISDPGGLAVDNFTFLNSGGEDFLRVHEPVNEKIKGFENPVTVYSVIGVKDPAEDEALRKFLAEFFAREGTLKILRLTDDELVKFKDEVEKRLSEPLSLPVK
jgi:adenylate cyclase